LNQHTRGGQETFDAYVEQLAANARDVGMEAASRADPDWFQTVLEWIWSLPEGYDFDADTIRREFGRSSAAGAAMRTARRRGHIEPSGVSQSRSASRHAGLQLRWVRLPG